MWFSVTKTVISPMKNRTIEDFLDIKVANDYSIENHKFTKVFREVFGSSAHLYKAYTFEIREVERFRSDLAAAMATDPSDYQKIAERWALFLKLRSTVMEFWSGLSAAFVAIFGLASAGYALLSSVSKQSPPTTLLLTMLAASLFFVATKFYIDKRAFWYKFLSSHLEAISKVGVHAVLQETSRSSAVRSL